MRDVIDAFGHLLGRANRHGNDEIVSPDDVGSWVGSLAREILERAIERDSREEKG